MFKTSGPQFFDSVLHRIFGYDHQIISTDFVSGGCINNTVRLKSNHGRFFLKWNEAPDALDLFRKEEKGLNILRQANCLNVPEVLGVGQIGSKSFLLLEHIDKSIPGKHFWESFGEKLAQLHQITNPVYGLDHDNYIGRLPQKNNPKSNWMDFFIENRLEVQLELAIHNHLVDSSFTNKFRGIYPQLADLLPQGPASLLHGDLWSGNFMVGPEGKPFIYDPAVYYGNREIEIAFTRLFGGFDLEFYKSYQAVFPLEPGFEDRIAIYNLYPLLVHLNLFGASYLSEIKQTISKFK